MIDSTVVDQFARKTVEEGTVKESGAKWVMLVLANLILLGPMFC
jgi:hypothetical protein